MRSRIIFISLALTAFALLGCGQKSVEDFRAVEAGLREASESTIEARISFCRTVKKSTGKRVGEGGIFGIGEGNRVRAFADFGNMATDKVHSIHMIWLQPGELFEKSKTAGMPWVEPIRHELKPTRKYAEVLVTEEDDGFRSRIHWRKPEDLNNYKEEIQNRASPSFSLGARLNIAPEKERALGLWMLRTYFNRELLTEQTFELVRPEITFFSDWDADSDQGLNSGLVFETGRKRKVHAQARVVGLQPGKQYAARMVWYKPGGKRLFAKKKTITADSGGAAMLRSSMRVSPKKKRPQGSYKVRLELDGSRVGQGSFELVKP